MGMHEISENWACTSTSQASGVYDPIHDQRRRTLVVLPSSQDALLEGIAGNGFDGIITLAGCSDCIVEPLENRRTAKQIDCKFDEQGESSFFNSGVTRRSWKSYTKNSS